MKLSTLGKLCLSLAMWATCVSGVSGFDFTAWKTKYGTPLTPAQFYQTCPWPWPDYFYDFYQPCADAWFFYLGPLGIKGRPFDQDLSTPVFAGYYPPPLTDSAGLIQNGWGVMNIPAGAPSDGYVYPGDTIIEIEDKTILSAADLMTQPYPITTKNSRGLETHTGQLVDAAEGRGAVKLKLVRAAKTAWTWSTLPAPVTSSEVSVPVTGENFVRLIVSSTNNALSNWINPRLENGSGGVIYLNTQAIVQKSGYATPVMGNDATNATVYDGSTVVTNCIGTRGNSMIEYAIPAGYTTLKFKIQETGSGTTMIPKIGLRRTTLATTPPNPRQYDANGKPVLPPELAPYIETVEFPIPQLGSFGATYDPYGEKVANYSAILADRLASEQLADGSWPSAGGDYAEAAFRTSFAGLGLMATGNPAYTTHIQKAATFCANDAFSTKAYPVGLRLMFLSEYYLRTRDAAILPGIQRLVKEAESMILPDFVVGHSYHPGYGGGGFLGATGTVSAGLALAAKCPVAVDTWRLDQMMNRIQTLAGEGNMGNLPYMRGSGPAPFLTVGHPSQGASCSAGVVLATVLRESPKHITDLFRNRFGEAIAYGDVDGGHASEALTFIMGSLACAIYGDTPLSRNMTAFIPRLTLKRDYSGYINLNTNQAEYHGGEGEVHGGPTYDTGGYLVLFNAHKRNLGITGKPDLKAAKYSDALPAHDNDWKLYRRAVNNWNMVEAALGTRMPSSLRPKLAELRSMPFGEDLIPRLLNFYQREALNAANLINGISGLTSPEKQYYCEMLLGIGHDMVVTNIDSPVPTSGLSNYRFSLKGYTPTSCWTEWSGAALSSDPAPNTQMSGTVTLSDPSGLYLPTPRVLNFGPGALNPTTDFKVPVSTQVTLNASFNYTVAGSLPISYTREFVVNLVVPYAYDPRSEPSTNIRKVWIPGANVGAFKNWSVRIQLPSGEELPGTSRHEGGVAFATYINGTPVPADQAFRDAMAGRTAGFLVTSSDRFGECVVTGVNLLPGPVVTTTAVSGVTASSATSGGAVSTDNGWPITARGVCWSTKPNPTIRDSKTYDGVATGSFTSSITGLQAGTMYYVRAYATNAYGTSYGDSFVITSNASTGVWTTNGGGSWPTTGNWQSGLVPVGADSIANFGTVTPASNATVTLNGDRAIGSMIFGNASFTQSWIISPGTGGNLLLKTGTSGATPTITVNGSRAAVDATIVGINGLTKAGAGVLDLLGANLYSGATTVTAGRLTVTGSISKASSVTVSSGATLAGVGTLGADLTVAGVLSPGDNSIATLTVGGRATLSGTTAMEVNKSTGTADKLAVAGALAYGGTLSVSNQGGTLALGDKITLFSASSYSGAFASYSLPTLAGGLKWDVRGLTVDGSILVGMDAAITAQPVAATVGQGESATFAVTATGTPTPTFQWQLSTNGGGTWTNIAGATTTSYSTAPAVSGDNGRLFRCVVTNGLATVNSSAATLTVNANVFPAFSANPATVVQTAAGQTATFTATATGSPTPTYQWQVSTNGGASWANISGATASSYSFTSVSGDSGSSYRCVATNVEGSRLSNSAMFVISADPVWIKTTGGSWPVASNWGNNSVASGNGVTADFSRLILPASPTVTLDGARTVGNLLFGDVGNAYGWNLATGSGGSLTLAVSSGWPTITVNGQSTTLSAPLTGTNGFVKNGPGNLILPGPNSYSGSTRLAAGTLTVNHASAINNSLTITGGTLACAAADPLTINADQAWNGDFSYAGPQGLTLVGSVTKDAARTITVSAGSLNINGPIGGAPDLTKNGAGTLVLNSGISFAGTFTANGGVTKLNSTGAYVLPAGTALTINNGATVQYALGSCFGSGTPVVINSGGTLHFMPYHAHLWSLTLNGGAITSEGAGKYNNEDLQLNSDVVIGGTSPSSINIVNGIGLGAGAGERTFTVADATGSPAADLTISGSGAMRHASVLVKAGPGTMVIANRNVNTGGTKISAGTLRLAGGTLGAGTTTVFPGTTLSGNGTASGSATINGNLSPGDGSTTGTLSFASNVTLSGTAVTTMKIVKSGTALTADNVTVTGTLACAGALNVTASGNALATGDTIQLFSASGITGTFSSVTLPTLSGGLVWDTSRLYIDGSISLGKIPQTIAFTLASPMNMGTSVSLGASASSGLLVSYTSSNPAVAAISYGNLLVTTGSGTTTITASQAGNVNYAAAPNVSITLTVNAVVPAVSTAPVVYVNSTTVNSGGTNIWDGGSAITERGVCWSTSPNPTVANTRTTNGTGAGSFTSTLTGLTPNTVYYVRAYAKNAIGYGYGGSVVYTMPVTSVWGPDADGSWPVTSNWTGGISPNGLDCTANFANVNITANRTVSLNSAATVGSMIFADTAASHNWILAPGTGGPLTLNASNGTPVITVNNQTATINVPIDGIKGLAKAGAGTLALGAINTYTGDTVVNAGKLVLGASGGTIRGKLTVNSGGAVDYSVGASFGTYLGSSINVLEINGGTVGGSNVGQHFWNNFQLNMTGGILYQGGTDNEWDNPTITVNASSAMASILGVAGTTAQARLWNGRAMTFNVADGSQPVDLTMDVPIVQMSGVSSMTKIGPGTMRLGAISTYTGGTFAGGGKLLLNVGGSTGTIRGTLSVGSGSTVDYTTANTFGWDTGASVNSLQINGGTVGGSDFGQHFWNAFQLSMTGGTLYQGGALNEWQNPTITINASSTLANISGIGATPQMRLRDYTPATFNVADGPLAVDFSVNVPITQNGVSAITKTGAGTMRLSATNTYTGGTTVSGGTLLLNATGAGNGAIRGTLTVNAGSTVNYSALDTFGWNSGASVNALNINGGTVGGADYGQHFWNNFQLSMTGGILYQGGTRNDWHNPTVTVNASATTARIVGVGTTPQMRLRDNTTGTFNVADGSVAVDLSVEMPVVQANGVSALVKNGTGTMQMTAANTYTGATTITAGTLLLTGSLSTTPVTVAATGTLAGTGSIAGAVTVNGTVSPGVSGQGTLTVNNTLTMAPASKIDWQVADWNGSAGTGYDTLALSALNITATSASKAIVKVSAPSLANYANVSRTFVLATVSGAVTGFSPSVIQLDTTAFTAGSGTWSIQQSGNQILLQYTTPPTGMSIPFAAGYQDVNGNGIDDTWEAAKFGNTAPGANLPGDDADKDGLSNLLEYALDTDPTKANPSPVAYDLEQVDSKTYLRLTVPKNSAASNLTYIVETSGDINAWSSADVVVETNTANQLIARDNVPTSAASRRFIRLQVVAAGAPVDN